MSANWWVSQWMTVRVSMSVSRFTWSPIFRALSVVFSRVVGMMARVKVGAGLAVGSVSSAMVSAGDAFDGDRTFGDEVDDGRLADRSGR